MLLNQQVSIEISSYLLNLKDLNYKIIIIHYYNILWIDSTYKF